MSTPVKHEAIQGSFLTYPLEIGWLVGGISAQRFNAIPNRLLEPQIALRLPFLDHQDS